MSDPAKRGFTSWFDRLHRILILSGAPFFTLAGVLTLAGGCADMTPKPIRPVVFVMALLLLGSYAAWSASLYGIRTDEEDGDEDV